jgi:hypothetical protein
MLEILLSPKPLAELARGALFRREYKAQNKRPNQSGR